jgi:hypothetical protein
VVDDKQNGQDAEQRRREVVARVTASERVMAQHRASRTAKERGEPFIGRVAVSVASGVARMRGDGLPSAQEVTLERSGCSVPRLRSGRPPTGARHMARPMPLAPPVTRVTRSFSFMFVPPPGGDRPTRCVPGPRRIARSTLR